MPNAFSMDAPYTLNRLRWQCRRSMLELELLLTPFVEARYPRLSSEQQQAFQRLLETPDAQLYEWLSGAAPSLPTNHPLKAIIQYVRDF